MAKNGLNFGEKIGIAGKSYRTLNDGIDPKKVLGDLRFGKIEQQEIVYEEEQQGGQTRQVNTGEVRGVTISVKSANQEQTVFVMITDMFESEIQELDLKYREPVELEDLVMTYSSIDGRDIFNFFASGIRKKGGNANPTKQEQKKPEDQPQTKN